MTNTLTTHDLTQFTGSENWYRHGLNRSILFTDGAKYVADTAGAHWLVDEIALHQFDAKVKAEEFQVWKLDVDLVKSSAVLTCGDGNDNVVFTKAFTFTDFPLETITFWFENNTIYLPSEH